MRAKTLVRKYEEDTDSDGRIILKWILKKQDDKVWTGSI